MIVLMCLIILMIIKNFNNCQTLAAVKDFHVQISSFLECNLLFNISSLLKSQATLGKHLGTELQY